MALRDHPYLRGRFVALAHRGGWLDPAQRGRENTAFAFEQALGLGYSHLETDLHTTADGELVAFHDPQLSRVTDGQGRIAALPWREISVLRVGGTDRVPRLVELLEQFPQARFNLDLKDERSVEELPALLRRTGACDRVCVASFSTSRLQRFRRLAPEVLTATTPAEVAWFAFPGPHRRRVPGSGAVLQVPARIVADRLPLVRPDVVAAAHTAGRAVHVWTVDEEAEMRRLIRIGVDGIVTNEIGILRTVLEELDLWEGPDEEHP